MSFLNKLVPNLFKQIQASTHCGFHMLTNAAVEPKPGGLFNVCMRTVIRCHFPRPSERKRIKRHGWNQRMSTISGRRIIMRKMLKGTYVYTH